MQDSKDQPVLPQVLWYKHGLRFDCQACGNCCTGPPGYVLFNDEELAAMADFLQISPARFLKQFTHVVFGMRSLTERRTRFGYDCVFLDRDADDRGTCRIYPVRPLQCRTWPWWHDNVRTPRAWQEAATGCPGIARGIRGEGELTEAETICSQCRQTENR